MIRLEEEMYLRKIENDDPLGPLVQSFYERLTRIPNEAQKVSETAGWRPTGINKQHYLDFAEARIRQFAPFQNEEGAILDPYNGREREYATASYAGAGAILLYAGHCQDLTASVLRAMDWAVYCLGSNQVPDDHADFTTHMLMKAYHLLTPLADQPRIKRWEVHFRNIEQEQTYAQVERNMPLKSIRNWATYSMHGEMMRYNEGFTSSLDFIDKYLEAQMTRFTAEGLYRDPNLPVAYDLAARDQMTGLLDEGYEGPCAGLLRKLLGRGAKTMLFMQSSTGETGCGGRSNQLLWNELTFAHLCEKEAVKYKALGDKVWMGVFKRAARRAFRAIQPWAEEPEAFRLAKNGFPIEERVGWEFYAFYSTYSLYAAKIAASCYYDADDTIEEKPAPCDVGGYVLHIPSFHRVYATSRPEHGSYHLTVDTAAQMGQDATGLVRLHRAGLPGETALSMGIAGLAGDIPWIYFRPRTKIPAPEYPAAIGVMWRDEHGAWYRLSNSGRRTHEVFHTVDAEGQSVEGQSLDWRCEVNEVEQMKDGLKFVVSYEANSMIRTTETNVEGNGNDIDETKMRAAVDILPRPGIGSCQKITEQYGISNSGLEVTWELESAEGGEMTGIGVTVPLIVTNGLDDSSIHIEQSAVTVVYKGNEYEVTACTQGDKRIELEVLPGLMPNRNAHYRLAQWVTHDALAITLQFQLKAMGIE